LTAVSQIIKAAVVQAGFVLFDTPKTMAKLAERTREAAGADLVVIPTLSRLGRRTHAQ
jgi:nitrilase